MAIVIGFYTSFPKVIQSLASTLKYIQKGVAIDLKVAEEIQKKICKAKKMPGAETVVVQDLNDFFCDKTLQDLLGLATLYKFTGEEIENNLGARNIFYYHEETFLGYQVTEHNTTVLTPKKMTPIKNYVKTLFDRLGIESHKNGSKVEPYLVIMPANCGKPAETYSIPTEKEEESKEQKAGSDLIKRLKEKEKMELKKAMNFVSVLQKELPPPAS